MPGEITFGGVELTGDLRREPDGDRPGRVPIGPDRPDRRFPRPSSDPRRPSASWTPGSCRSNPFATAPPFGSHSSSRSPDPPAAAVAPMNAPHRVARDHRARAWIWAGLGRKEAPVGRRVNLTVVCPP